MKRPNVSLSIIGSLCVALGVPATAAWAAPSTRGAKVHRSTTRGGKAPKASRHRAKRHPALGGKVQRAVGQSIPSATLKLTNGKIHVNPEQSLEFETWLDRLEFEVAPDQLEARWSNLIVAADFAKWEIREVVGSKKTFVASGQLTSTPAIGGQKKFDIAPAAVMPKYNDGPKDRTYELSVFSGDDNAKLHPSYSAKLVHKRRGSTAPKPHDPFSCSGNSSHARKVKLTAPSMVVHNTSTTEGDDDGQDELEFRVARWKNPNNHNSFHLPGGDVGYALNQGAHITVFDWHNDNDDSVSAPVFVDEVLQHGQSVAVSVLAIERDNVHLKKIKEFIILGHEMVAAVAPLLGGWGKVVGKAAEGVIDANELLAPDTDGHDYVGQFAVVLENRCGRIKAAWLTLGPGSLSGEPVFAGFLDPSVRPETNKFDARAVSMHKPGPGDTFSPSGWDYGDWRPVGADDPVMWVVQGTSGLQYSFVLLGQTDFVSNAAPKGRAG